MQDRHLVLLSTKKSLRQEASPQENLSCCSSKFSQVRSPGFTPGRWTLTLCLWRWKKIYHFTHPSILFYTCTYSVQNAKLFCVKHCRKGRNKICYPALKMLELILNKRKDLMKAGNNKEWDWTQQKHWWRIIFVFVTVRHKNDESFRWLLPIWGMFG